MPIKYRHIGIVSMLINVVINVEDDTTFGFTLNWTASIVEFAATGIAFNKMNTIFIVSSTGMIMTSAAAMIGDSTIRMDTTAVMSLISKLSLVIRASCIPKISMTTGIAAFPVISTISRIP